MREFKYQSSGNKTYRILYTIIGEDVCDYHHVYGKRFDICTLEDNAVIMGYVLEIEEDLLKDLDDNSRDLVLTRIGLLEVFSSLDKGEIGNRRKRISTNLELGLKGSNWFIRYPKICLFREGEGKEFICTLSELHNKTKIPIDCQHCPNPEDFLRCEYLHPKKDIGTPPHAVGFSARCHLGKGIDPLKIHECQNLNCFEPITMKSKAFKNIEGKLPKDSLISQCFTLIDNVNNVFNRKHSFKLFRIMESRAMSDLPKPCNSEDDFSKLILILGNLIDWIDVDNLKANIKNPPSDIGSINLLAQFLKESSFKNSEQLIGRLRRIKRIGTKYPRHVDKPKLLEDFQELGFSYPPNNWAEVWSVIIREFLVSLSELKEGLSN